jgi:hypothetical protein
MKDSVFPRGRHDDLVMLELGDELIVYDLKTNKASSLNSTAAAIWNACDGKKSVPDIAREFGEKAKTNANEDLVLLALESFRTANLLANEDEIPVAFQGPSRRQMIKTVGMATAVALPLVASIVEPAASAAASTCAATGTSCVAAGGASFLTCCGGPNITCCGTLASAFCIDTGGSGDCGATN